jgi:hypothetical protein
MANKIVTYSQSPVTFDIHRMSMPQYLSTKVNYSSRTGVDGHSIWLAGTRGEPFELITWTDFSTLALAWSEYTFGYLKLRGSLVDVTYEDTFTSHTLRCVVTNVQKVGKGVYPILVGAGGQVGSLNTNGGAVHARWTMLGIEEISG